MSFLGFLKEDENDPYEEKWSKLAELDDEDIEDLDMMDDDHAASGPLSQHASEAQPSSRLTNPDHGQRPTTPVATSRSGPDPSTPLVDPSNPVMSPSPSRSKRLLAVSEGSSGSPPKRRRTSDLGSDRDAGQNGIPIERVDVARTIPADTGIQPNQGIEETGVEIPRPNEEPKAPGPDLTSLNDEARSINQRNDVSSGDSIPPQQTKDKHAEDVSPGPQQSQTVSLSSPTFDKVEQAAPQDTASPERQFKSPPKSQINKDLHIPIQRANSLPHPLPLRGARGKSGLADMVPRASSLTAISSSRTMTDEAAIELIPKEQLRELFKPVFLKQIAQQNSSINANEALKFITDEDILGLAKLMPPVMAQVRASEIEAGEPDAQQQSEPTDQLQAEPLEPEDHDGEAMADVSLPELASSVNDDDKYMTDERAPSPDVAMVDVMPSPPRKPAEPPLTTDTGDAEPANDKASESPDIPLIELVSSRRAIPPSQQSAVPSAPPMPAIVALDAQKPLLELTHTSHMDVDEVLAADSGLLEPIVCCAFQGTLHPTTSHHQFTISKQAAFQAKQWCDRFDSYRSSNSFTRFQVRLFSDVSATEDSNTLNRTPLPILIRINNDHLQVYGEHEFSSNNQSFCINPFIVPGTNTLEVIQTGSMEGWTIFVEQVRPSEPELKELSQHHSKTNDWLNFLRKIGNCQLLPQPTFADVDS